MSVSYIGNGLAATSGTTFTIASHANTKFGDLMVLMAHIGGAVSITSITGGSSPTWSQWGFIRTSNGLTNMVVFTARAAAADIGATFTVTPNASTQVNACLATYRSSINTPTLGPLLNTIDNTTAAAIVAATWNNSNGGIGVSFAGANTFTTTMTCTPTGAAWTEIADHVNSGLIATDYCNDTSTSGSSNTGCTFTWTKTSSSRAAITFTVLDGPTAPIMINESGATAASGTSIAITYPTGVQAGDLLVAAIGNVSTSSALVQPAGWTLLDNPAGAIASMYKIADGTETSGSVTWSWTGASVSCGLMVLVRGVSRSPIDTSGAQANASSTSLTAPTITPRWAACLLLNFYVDNGANTITVPAQQSFSGATSGNTRSITAGWEPLNSNAATGTRVATATAAVNYGFALAIRGPQTPIVVLPDSAIGSNNGVQAYRDASLPVGPVNSAIGFGAQWAGRDPFTGFPGNSWQGWGGTASISGTCNVGTQPLANIWVYLSPMSSQGTVIAAQYTGADGTFSFTGIAPGLYVVEGVDPSGTYNGEIYEEVTAY